MPPAPPRAWRLIAPCLGLVLAALGSVASAANFVVNTAADSSNPNDGLTSLREAISAANTAGGANTITFDGAVFSVSTPSNIQLTGALPDITSNLTITGPGANAATINGSGSGIGARILRVTAGRVVSLSGLTLSNSFQQGPTGSAGVDAGTPPTAGGAAVGGAIYNSGSLTITECFFANNSAIGGGGGAAAGNLAQNGAVGGDGLGGAIYSDGTALAVQRCSFIGNSARGGGGGAGASIQLAGGSSGNGAAAGHGKGGAIYVAAGTTSIVNSTLATNSAIGGMGGAGGASSFSTSAQNPGGVGGNGEGGGIFAAVPVTVTSCTVASGAANPGSGGTQTDFSHFAASGVAHGGGLRAGATITLGNTIVARNTQQDPITLAFGADDVFGAFTTANFNLIGAIDGGSGINGSADQKGSAATRLDPKLDTSGPVDNGGTMPTLRIVRGSTAADRGKDLSGAGVDQRGLPRPFDLLDGNFPNAGGGDGSDIGAFESQTVPNNRPQAFGGSVLSGAVGTALSGQKVSGFDPDSDPLTYSVVGSGLPASLTLNADGTLTGTPTASGQVQVSFKVNDGYEDSAPATFRLDIAEKGSLIVNTTSDDSTAYDGLTSLREAIAFAQVDGVSTPVTFDSAVFATPQTITLNAQKAAITTSSAFDLNGPAAGVTVSGAAQTALFIINGGTVRLSKLTLAQGLAPVGGGGGAVRVSGASTSVTLTGCTLRDSGRSSGGLCFGGALRNSGGAVTLINCTLAGNSAVGSGSGGGAIYQDGGTLTVHNCTIARNDVGAGSGGGLWIAGGTLSLGNTILSGNTAAGGTSPDANGTIGSLGFNLIGDVTGATITGTTTGNRLGVDPLLDTVGLAFNGGPTPTIRLRFGSPAIDAGKVFGSVSTDQRGVIRPFDQPTITNVAGGDGSDIGAYEGQVAAPEISVQPNPGPDLRSGVSTVDFGSSEVGNPTMVNFLVSNVGNAPLNLTASATTKVVLLGGNASDFTVTQQPTSPLAPGDSVAFAINFHPVTTGVKTTTVRIANNDADENPFTFTISGTATDTSTITPLITSPSPGTKVAPLATVTFTLPEAALAGSVSLSFDNGTTYAFPVTTNSAGSHTMTLDTVAAGMTVGVYALKLTYRDVLAHAAATATNANIRLGPANPVTNTLIVQGAAAPGAGTNGLPGDAILSSFNAPATDDQGDLAYIARWSSNGGRLKGTGLFLNNTCLGVVGGDASAVIGTTGAKWRSFTDPIVDAGHVVCIASLTGVARDATTAVVCNLTGATLEKIAQAGSVDTSSEAKFKAFKAVAITGDKLIYLAQLTLGTGTSPKTTAANDLGLWFQEPGNNFLSVRESAGLGSSTIGTLTAFLAGAGSPAQGRGWLIQPESGGDPQLMALATLANRSRAVVVRDVGLNDLTPLSLAGDLGEGSPSINDAAFATYGVPARNAAEQTVFVATLKLNPLISVTRANMEGIFTNTGLTGKYTPIVRSADFALGGASFAILKDPVISSDGAIAFPATLAGVSARGLPAQSLWWRPVGGNLTLLAQGGKRPGNDLPAAAQFKTFTSLAIAGGGRGPIFAATLVPGKGGVLATSASGVWATDYKNEVRVLFRTGDLIGDKKVKSFNVLKATAGAVAVTRSFNDHPEVVWQATFTDNTQAIIRTEVP